MQRTKKQNKGKTGQSNTKKFHNQFLVSVVTKNLIEDVEYCVYSNKSTRLPKHDQRFCCKRFTTVC